MKVRCEYCDNLVDDCYNGDTYYSNSDYTDIRDSSYYDSSWDGDW